MRHAGSGKDLPFLRTKALHLRFERAEVAISINLKRNVLGPLFATRNMVRDLVRETYPHTEEVRLSGARFVVTGWSFGGIGLRRQLVARLDVINAEIRPFREELEGLERLGRVLDRELKFIEAEIATF